MNTFESDPKRRALLELLLREEGLKPPSAPKIARRDSTAPVPLSITQQQMWFLHQLAPESPCYNIPVVFRLEGSLDASALEKSLNEIIRRHESLRTTFVILEEVPEQVIAPCLVIPLSIVDLTLTPEPDREAKARLLATEEARRPFDLTEGPLLRFSLLRLGELNHLLIIISHHIVTDGSSWRVFFHELEALYKVFSDGMPSPLPEPSLQYADFVQWQHAQLQGDTFEQCLSYWKKQLDHAPGLLNLPTDRPRPMVQTFRGASQAIVLPKALLEDLRAISRHENATLFMTLLAAFQLMLSRLTGQEDIAVGSPIEGRNCSEAEGLIGLFINTLVLRTDVGENPSFCELLARVREVVLGAFAHQNIPYEKLMGELRTVRSLDRNTLFQTMFNFRQSATGANLNLFRLSIKKFPIRMGVAKFDLLLSVIERPENLRCSFTFNTDLFDASTIARWLGYFQILLENVAANPKRRVLDLPLFSGTERHRLLLEWNNTCCDFPQGKSVHELFEAQVRRASDATAVILEGERLSYGELNRRANQLAGRLRTLGVGPGVMVGLCLERSLEMIVGVLGILKAGGAYVPLDPAYPIGRLAFMLEDTQAPVLLTQQKLLRELIKDRAIQPLFSAAEGEKAGISQFSVVDRRITVLCLDADWQDIAQESEENPPTGVNAEDLAYLIYTSGSTGKPKGVEITHRALANFVHHTGNALALDGADRVLQFASISFDTAAEEIFPCLIRGATLVLRTECMIDSVAVFLEKCLEWGVTVLDLPTVYWHELIEGLSTQSLTIPESLRLVIIGGERADPERLAQWWSAIGDRVRLLNTYGPTEATVVATTWEANGANPIAQPLREVPIGRPIANVQTYILDQYLNPVPIGVRGELYIGGEGVAAGYLNCPDLTADRFIPDPFSPVSGARLYKTGDLARYLSDGNIEFIGRLDHQVKIRGFRIELGEIEEALAQHPAVRETVVIAQYDTKENQDVRENPQSKIQNPTSDTRLIAYVVPNPEHAPTVSDLRDFLQEKLPNYMIPAAFVMLDTLPLTPSGKLDRKALPTPDGTTHSCGDLFIAPRDDVEYQLSRIWESVLGTEPIGVTDNFFDLGGHSLLAVRLFTEIEKSTGRKLPVATLFRAPTVEQLARIFRLETSVINYSSLVPIQPDGSKPPLFLVHGADGGVFDFTHLARHMGPDQPLYGLQSPGYDGEREPLTQIESIAAHYVDEIRKAAPQGPYLLAGLCLGGTVAFEMSQQLEAQGQTVALLTLVDAPLIPRMSLLRYWMLSCQRKFKHHVVQRFNHHRRNLRQLGIHERLVYALEKVDGARRRLISRGFLNKTDSETKIRPEYRAKVDSANIKARRHYVPQQYRGRIILFLADDSPIKSAHDRRLAWKELALGGVEVHTIPGDHNTMIWDPHAHTLAQKLRASVDQALSTNAY